MMKGAARPSAWAIATVHATAITTALCLSLLLSARSAEAARFHVQSTTVGQGYQQVTSDRGLLNRRRISQTLGLGVYDLLGDDSDRLSLVTRLRVDSDFGLSDKEVDVTRGLSNHTFLLMLGYVEGRELVPWTDFRVGRQLLSDPASGLVLMDGLHMEVRTPWFLGVRGLAGVESKRGVMTGSELELDGGEAGSENQAATTVIVGGGVFLAGLRDVVARVDYQRWLSDGAVDREVVAGSAWWRPLPWLSLGGDARWDLFVSAIDSARAELRVRPWSPIELRFDYERYLPVFRATSIFNVFASDPYDELGGSVRLRVGDRFDGYVGGGARLYGTADAEGHAVGVVLRGGGRLRLGRATTLRFDLLQETGSGGTLGLVDLGVRQGFSDDVMGMEGRVTVVRQDDPSHPERRTNAFGVELGAWFRVRDVATLHLLVEDNESGLQRHAVRVMAVADVSLWMND